jgi:MFS family permease
MPIGMGVSFLIGGYVASQFGWRSTFFVAGAPSLLLAALVLASFREPRRGATEGHESLSLTDEYVGNYIDALRFTWRNRPVLGAILGVAIY